MARRAAAAFALLGGALVVGSNLAGGSPSLGMLGFTLWALVPYAALWAASVLPGVDDPWPFLGAGALAVAVEAGVRASVFVFPRGSTAAIALVFSPGLILLTLLPGALAGRLLGRAWRSGVAPLRAAAGIAAGAALALVVVGFARPDLLPTAVASRRAALRAIGEPRVVRGGEAFRKVTVSGGSAWHMAADLDGRPGDELAVATAVGADLFDASSLIPKGRVVFGADLRWSWSSTLARVGGQVAVVQTGGGFSETEVRSPDGTLLWSYRPDPKLPPTALRPADLEGAGSAALYAATASAVERLDAKGKPVWSRPARSPQLLALAPRTAHSTAWVVTREYGSPAKVWDENGQVLGELPLGPLDDPAGVVDWPLLRGLAVGREEARVLGLDGRAVFRFPLAPMRLVSAESVRPSASAKPLLALLAAGPRGVPRWRLVLLDASGTPVYDEVFASPLRLLKARLPGGGEELLLSSAAGLQALR